MKVCRWLLIATCGEYAPTQLVNDSLNALKVIILIQKNEECSGQSKKCKRADLWALLDEDARKKTLKQLGELLNVAQILPFWTSTCIGKDPGGRKMSCVRIDRKRYWKAKIVDDILLARQKRKRFLQWVVTGDEIWNNSIITYVRSYSWTATNAYVGPQEIHRTNSKWWSCTASWSNP